MTPQAARFRQIVAGPDEAINLAEAALLIASEEYPDLDIAAYLARLDEMAAVPGRGGEKLDRGEGRGRRTCGG